MDGDGDPGPRRSGQNRLSCDEVAEAGMTNAEKPTTAAHRSGSDRPPSTICGTSLSSVSRDYTHLCPVCLVPPDRLTFLSQVMLDVRARKRMGPRVPRGLVVDLGLLSSDELGWRVERGRPWPAVDPAARVDRGSRVKGRP